MSVILGIDVGGTKISVSIGDEAGHVLAAAREPTNSSEGPDQGLERICALVDKVLAENGHSLDGIDAVGLAVPGPISLAKGMLLKPPNMHGWENLPVVSYFEERLGKPIHMNNDANGAGLAEWLFGEFRGTPDLIYLTMSTGIGGGVISNGRLVQGASDMGGEVGHFVLDPGGPPCGCGQPGCFEAYCGGKSVAERIQQDIRHTGVSTSIVELVDGDLDKIDFRIFREAVKAGDVYAKERWREFIERLAQGIGSLMMVLNPRAIVLGTIAIHSGELLMGPLMEALPRYAWHGAIEACSIRASALGTHIGDLGALSIAIAALNK